jgi:hypothetical protein
MAFDAPGSDGMTGAELGALERELQLLDPAEFSGQDYGAVAAFNERVRLAAELLGEATAALAAGSRIAPELARTIRLSAAAVRARRARLMSGAHRAGS